VSAAGARGRLSGAAGRVTDGTVRVDAIGRT
jgi:hypothetical protein